MFIDDLKGTIRAVNQELKQYAKMFGNDSRVVSDYMKALENVVGERNTYVNARTGAIQFRNTKRARERLSESEGGGSAIEDWYSTEPTFEQYMDHLANQYQKETGEAPTDEDLRDYQKDIDEVRNASEDGRLSDILSDQKRQGADVRHLTYRDMADMLRDYGEYDSRTQRATDAININKSPILSGKKPKIGKGKGGGLRHEGVSVKRI